MTGEFLRCAAGGDCYKAKVQCDGDPDCADESDEDPTVCDTTRAPPAVNTPAPAVNTPTPEGTGDSDVMTIIAVCSVVLLVVAAAAVWWFGCRGGGAKGEDGGNEQVQVCAGTLQTSALSRCHGRRQHA